MDPDPFWTPGKDFTFRLFLRVLRTLRCDSFFFLYFDKLLSDRKGTFSKAQLLYLSLQFTILNKNSLMPSRNSFRLKPQSGFALVIALGLMSFIVLLLLGITTFVRVESSAAAQSLRILEARQNALLGMQIALGELQAAAGPDQRVTAKADLFNNTHQTRRHLTGVWNTSTGNFQQWLVSDFNRHGSSADTQAFAQSAAPNPANDDTVVLLGPGSLDSSGGVLANAADAVVVGMANTGINATNRLVGRYAWWIDDEGVKARVNLDNPFFAEGKQSSVLALNSFNRGEVGFLPDFSGFNLEQDEVSRISSIRDLSLSGVDAEATRRYFFDFTTWSAGVLADVRDGGLKRDLSLAFELPDGDFNASVFSAAGPRTASGPGLSFLVQPIFYCSNDGRGPTWHLLRDYYTIYKRIQNPMTDPVFTAQAIAPNTFDSGISVLNQGTGNELWWETLPAMRFQGFEAIKSGLNGDALRSLAPPSGDNRLAIPIPIRANYTPYVQRNLVSFGIRFRPAVPNPRHAGDPGDWEYRRSEVLVNPAFVVHNPYNVRVRSHGLFSLTDHVRFNVRFRHSLTGTVETFPTGGNRHILKAAPSIYGPGELRIYEGLIQDDVTNFSGTGVPGDYWEPAQAASPFINQRIPVEIPADPDEPSPPNVRVTFEPFNNQRWAHYVKHNMGNSANPVQATTSRAEFSSQTLSYGGHRSHFVWREYEDWYSTQVEPGIEANTENFRQDFDDAPLDFFNYDLFLKPSNHRFRYPVFSHTNPLAPNIMLNNLFTSTQTARTGYPVYSPDWQLEVYSTNFPGMDVLQSSGTSAYWGNSNQASGQTNVAVIELPTTPPLSLGKLQNANLGIFGVMPALAIGNSFASPFLPRSSNSETFSNLLRPSPQFGGNERVFYDLSYLANEALWDSYFFSSYSLVYNRTADAYVPVLGPRGSFDAAFDPSFDRAGVLRGTLPNSRMQLFAPRETLAEVRDKLFRGNGDPALRGYDRAAENLLVAGSFNIHSTSVEAWRSVLSAARNLPVYRSGQSGSESYGSDRTPLSRLSQPTEGPFNGNINHSSAWGGFNALTDSQIEDLASAIVEELKLRVNDSLPNRPFVGLAEFVNRKLVSNDLGLAGLLQAAIDKSGINDDFASSTAIVTGDFPSQNNIETADGRNRSSASGATTKILQGAVLQAIGSFISPRSDTFRIRSYGEVISATPGGRDVKAWAEAVYQRVPEPAVPSTASPADQNFWVPQEIDRFGRRFMLVSFRWLTEDEV